MADKPLAQAQSILEELLAAMGVEATVTAQDEEPPTLAIDTAEPGNLIGPRGDGIRSLQHLLRVVLVHQGYELPVVVDVDGYRERKETQLKELAQRKAEQVRTTGRLAVLAPMSSYERRVVHVTLRDEDGIITESLGEGLNRRVMIKKQG